MSQFLTIYNRVMALVYHQHFISAQLLDGFRPNSAYELMLNRSKCRFGLLHTVMALDYCQNFFFFIQYL